jgi:CHAT domain-containing protein/tetratricopeptide (TPR) repeat protein
VTIQDLGESTALLPGALALALLWYPAAGDAQGAERRVRPDRIATQTPPDTNAKPGHATFAEALRLLDSGDHDAARQQFELALQVAHESGDLRLQAGCHRGLGLIAGALGNHADAANEHRLARDLFLAAGDRAFAGASGQSLGTALYWLGERDRAREAWEAALADYEAVDDRAQQASAVYNLTFVDPDPERKRALLDRGLVLAREAASRPLEGQLLAARSDLAFTRGDYLGAYDDLLESIAVLADAGSAGRKGLAHAYTSLGRLYRAHAQFDRAIAAYERAMHIGRDTGDLFVQAQAARAIAIAYEYLGETGQRRRFLELSLELIGKTGAVDEQHFAEIHLASFLVERGDLRRAFEILDRLGETDWGRGNEWAQNTLARARAAAGDAAGALEPASRAVHLARSAGDVERLFHDLQVRAEVYLALARHEEAVGDLRAALDLVEQLRQRLVPHDYMKRGFMDRFAQVFGLTIEALEALGRHTEAIDVTERARARAFADLLMARRVRRQPEPLPLASVLGRAAAPVRPATTPAGTDVSVQRGGASWPPAGEADDLPSDALSPPAVIADLQRAAAASGAAILSYWVAEHTTWAWVISPRGEVTSARIRVPRTSLHDLVLGVWQSGQKPATKADSTTRGRGVSAPRATRELHRLLVEPVLESLSRAATRRLIVIPHGPLSALSFAALQDAQGRYLVEDYAISYVPAGWMLARPAAPSGATPASYLLVGAPAAVVGDDGQRRLPPLPGANRELARVAARLRGRPTLRLHGPDASEARFRAAAANASVVHVATHGVILDDTPLDSFLAFDISGTSGGRADDDGRLTVREVYDLDLHARLVVLSACRSGLGRLSGDGLHGLARAFFYAGAQALVATLWDVADEPAARLMPRFHALVADGMPVTDALRTAQLALLGDLRAGRVIVRGRRGPVPLPEHPSLWAGFVLIGDSAR